MWFSWTNVSCGSKEPFLCWTFMTMFFNVEDIPCRTPLHHFQFGRCLYPNPIANPLYHFSHFTNKQTITKAWKLHLENRLFSPTSSAFFLHIGWMQNFEPTGLLDAPYPSSLTCRKGLCFQHWRIKFDGITSPLRRLPLKAPLLCSEWWNWQQETSFGP